MSSTYDPTLGLELIGTNDQQGSWGITTNTNLGTLLAEAIAGVASVSVTSANVDLTYTAPPAQTQTGRHAVLFLNGTSTASRTIFVNASPKVYIIANNTAGGFDHKIQVTGGAGTFATIPTGKIVLVFTDAYDFYSGVTYVPGAALLTGATFSGAVALPSNGLTVGTTQLAVSGGNVSVGGNLTVGGTATITGAEIVSSNITVSGISTLNGAINLGDNSSDTLTVTATGTFASPVTYSAAATFSSNATFNGNVTLGDASGDAITVTGTATFGQVGTFSSGLQVVSSISASPSIHCSTDTNTGMYLSGADTLGLTTSGVSRVFVASDGKTGIGTASPDFLLTVAGAAVQRPGSSVTPTTNGDVAVEATSNTSLTFKLKGSDGVIRSGVLTLA